MRHRNWSVRVAIAIRATGHRDLGVHILGDPSRVKFSGVHGEARRPTSG